MSKVTAKCPFCEQLFLMERPLFKSEREQTACPACANEARRNTERMLRLHGGVVKKGLTTPTHSSRPVPMPSQSPPPKKKRCAAALAVSTSELLAAEADMSDEKIDVLAVMDAEIASLPEIAKMVGWPGATCEASVAIARLTDARAAVAKFIDAGEKMRRGLIEPDDHKRRGIYTFQRDDVRAFFDALDRVRSS